MHKPILCIMLSLSLASCRSSKEKTVLPATREAREAVTLTQSLSQLNFAVITAISSPLLGPYVGGFLALTGGPPYRGSLQAIEAQSTLLFARDKQDKESTEVLANLGSALEVNILDLLNRSPDREDTLNEYIRALRILLETGDNQRQALEGRIETLSDERRVSRRKTADIQHDLNQALRERNYSIAGSKQEELTTAEQETASLDAREHHLQSMMDIYEDFLETTQERLTAIEANRKALIAGVQVTEVPGIEDIGVLKSNDRRRSRGGGNLFDPGAL